MTHTFGPLSLLLGAMLAGCAPTLPEPSSSRQLACPDFGPRQAAEATGQALADLGEGSLDALDAALAVANRVERCQPDSPGLVELEAALGAVAEARAADLAGEGAYAQARFLLARLSGRLDLAEQLREVERAWAVELGRLAGLDEAGQRWASALARRSMAARLDGSPSSEAAREAAVERFRGLGPVAVELELQASPRQRQALERWLEQELSPALRLAVDGAPAELIGTLIVQEPRCEERRVTSVVSRPWTPPGWAAAQQTRRAAELMQDRTWRELVAAAEGDRKLEAAVALLEGEPDASLHDRVAQLPELLAWREARASLAALGPAPEPPAPFNLELVRVTLSCQVSAELVIGQAAGEPSIFGLEGQAESSDSTHPAMVEQGLGEDPLELEHGLEGLGALALRDLAAQLEERLEEQVQHRALVGPAPTSIEGLGTAELEAAARGAMLGMLLDPPLDDPSLRAFLEAAFSLDDREALPLP
jgi:hypothetical protein